MSQPDWQAAGAKHVWMPYTQMKTAPQPLPVERTTGCEIVLSDGRRLLDAISSWWTVAHGYNHPHLVSAIQSQAEKMSHVMMGGLQNEPALNLAGRLAGLLPGQLNRVFFCDSGSVSVEVALKIAVQYWLNVGRQSKNRFVCFADSYHGDTVGAMSVCDPLDSMHAHFKGYLLEQYPRALPESDDEWGEFFEFIETHIDSLAGVIIEPLIQAAGGMRFHSPTQLRRLAQYCQQQELLFIADEIATGFGRTGTLFAIEQANIIPDVICLGKALTGGALGMAATVATDDVFSAFYRDDPAAALMHGPTFMGNPLACAAANASLDLFQKEPRLEQARALEQLFEDRLNSLRELNTVVDVRCRGAVAVIQFDKDLPKYEIMQQAIDRGVWLRPLRDVIYLMPPLVINESQALELCSVVGEIVAELASAESKPTTC